MIRISEIFGPTIQGEGALIGQPTVFVRTGGCDYRCGWCDTLHAVDSEYRYTWQPMTAENIFAQVEKLSGGVPLMVSLSGGNPAIQPLGALIALGKSQGYRFALETQGSIAKDWFADLDILTLSPKPPSSGMITDWAALDTCVQVAQTATPLPLRPQAVRELGEDSESQQTQCADAKLGEGYSRISPSPSSLRDATSPDGRGVKTDASPRVTLKIVVFDDIDYQYAKDTAARYPHLPIYLQPGNHTPPSPEKNDDAIDLPGIMDRMRWLVDKVVADRWFNATVLPQLHVLLWGNLRGV